MKNSRNIDSEVILRKRYKNDIVSAQATGTNVVELLKKKNFIESYILSRNHVDMRNLVCTLEYNCKIKGLPECFHVKLCLLLQSTRNNVFEETENNGRRIEIEANFFLKEKIFQNLRHCFIKWQSGMTREKMFKIFLDRLKLKYPQFIRSVTQADRYSDKYLGYDFNVKFCFDLEANLIEQVNFNLKASYDFLEKHIRKHPNVSTFVLFREDLLYYSELEKNFFAFLLASRNWTVHY